MSLPDLPGESGFSLLTRYHIFCPSVYMIYLVVFLFPNRPPARVSSVRAFYSSVLLLLTGVTCLLQARQRAL